MKTKGVLIVISGFAGAGKGSIVKGLINQYEGQYALSVSATTRPARNGEIHGKEYFFLTKEEFERQIDEGNFIEYANYVGNYYGTPKDYVLDQLEQGKNVILEIEVQGAAKVREAYQDALLLFVTPPSVDELSKRLIGRGTETLEVVEKRMQRAYEEAKLMSTYDYLIVNDVLEEAIKQTHYIIQNEHFGIRQNVDFIENIQTQLKNYNKGE